MFGVLLEYKTKVSFYFVSGGGGFSLIGCNFFIWGRPAFFILLYFVFADNYYGLGKSFQNFFVYWF